VKPAPLDEYQSCSGIGHDANKKTVVERKDPAEAEAHLHFEAFCGPIEVVPCYKATTHRFLLQDCLSKHDIHLPLLILPINSVMASHPFARKKAKGWGTECLGVNPFSICGPDQ
jgi:hypothetical protein